MKQKCSNLKPEIFSLSSNEYQSWEFFYLFVLVAWSNFGEYKTNIKTWHTEKYTPFCISSLRNIFFLFNRMNIKKVFFSRKFFWGNLSKIELERKLSERLRIISFLYENWRNSWVINNILHLPILIQRKTFKYFT